jgi:rhodanese-related sulfurtransferase
MAGGRSALAAQTLQKMGLERVSHMGGGFNAWVEAGGAIER